MRVWCVALAALSLTNCGESAHQPSDSTPNGGMSGTSGAAGKAGGSAGIGAGAAGGSAGTTSAIEAGAAGEASGGSAGRGDGGTGATDGGGAPPGGSSNAGSGAAGQPCDSGAASACDDGNDCTLDVLGEDCACLHEAVTDERACDDGEVCTQGDHCDGATCGGEQTESSPEVLGSVHGFGSGPGLESIVAFDTEERVLFASGSTLTLVEIDGDDLKALDHHDLNTGVASDSAGAMVWIPRPRSWLLPVVGERVAFVSAYWGIDLYDLSGDVITPSERWSFSAFEDALSAAAGWDRRVWICVSSRILTFWIDPITFELTSGPSLLLPSGHECQELAVTPDGQTLLAATQGGLDLVDVSNGDGSMSVRETLFADTYLLSVRANAEHLAVFQLIDNFSGDSVVRVVDAETLDTVVDFPFDPDSGPAATGFALLDGGHLLLQLLERDGCATQSVELYELEATGANLLESFNMLEACKTEFDQPALNTVALGSHVALEPMHQLVRVDPDTQAISALHGPAQGSFERVRGLTDHRVAAFGPGSGHVIDLSDPGAPLLTQGSLSTPVRTEELRFEVSPSGVPLLLTVPQDGRVRSGPVTSLLFGDGTELATLDGSVANDDDEDASWITAGAFAYELGKVDAATLRIRRFPGSSLTHDPLQSWASSVDQVLEPELPSELDSRNGAAFHVDARSGELVVLERRSQAGVSGSNANVLSWFSPSGAGFQLESTLELGAESFREVLLAAGQAAVLAEESLALFADGGARRDLAFPDYTAVGLLAFDGPRLYLSVRFTDQGRSPGVVVLRASDLDEIARYTTPDRVDSLAFSDGRLVFGMRSALTVASPACQAAPLLEKALGTTPQPR